MDKKKKELVINYSILFIGVVVGIVIGAIMFAYMVTWIDDEHIDMCSDEIEGRGNITDDYRDGWMDCIEYLIRVRQQATNLTQQLI